MDASKIKQLNSIWAKLQKESADQADTEKYSRDESKSLEDLNRKTTWTCNGGCDGGCRWHNPDDSEQDEATPDTSYTP